MCRHKLGTSDIEDVEIYTESDDTFYVSISKSRSNKFLIIHSSQTISNEDLYLSLDSPLELPKVFSKDTQTLNIRLIISMTLFIF